MWVSFPEQIVPMFVGIPPHIEGVRNEESALA